MSGGQFGVPVVIRMATGAGKQLAAQHSHSLEGWFAHIPGLKVLAPATLEDARGMLWTALEDPDPVLIFENVMLYNRTGLLDSLCRCRWTFRKPRSGRPGKDVTLITYGGSLWKTLEAAEELAADGIDAEVIDLRVLRPLDEATIMASVGRTRRAVIVDEGWKSGSLSAEIAARIHERIFWHMDAPVERICAAEVPIPYPSHLEQAAIPQVPQIVAAAKATLGRCSHAHFPDALPGRRHGRRHACRLARGAGGSGEARRYCRRGGDPERRHRNRDLRGRDRAIARCGAWRQTASGRAAGDDPGRGGGAALCPGGAGDRAGACPRRGGCNTRGAAASAGRTADDPRNCRLARLAETGGGTRDRARNHCRKRPRRGGDAARCDGGKNRRAGDCHSQAIRRDGGDAQGNCAAMQRSKREIPHFQLSQSIDIQTAADWLAARNAKLPPAERILLGTLFMKAAARAAAKVKEMNGHYGADGFVPAPQVNLGSRWPCAAVG